MVQVGSDLNWRLKKVKIIQRPFGQYTALLCDDALDQSKMPRSETLQASGEILRRRGLNPLQFPASFYLGQFPKH